MRPFLHEDVPVAIRITRALGITASAFLAGEPPHAMLLDAE